MPTDVIEKPETAQPVPRESSSRRSAIDDILGPGARGTRPVESAQQKPSRIAALLHRIFAGHREFLGWTPD